MISKTAWGSVVALSVSAVLCGTAMAQPMQYQQQYQQYQGYQQQYPAAPVQSYQANPAPATPSSWSYDPYTSGLGPCPQRFRGDDKCSETVSPTAGQPNYWVRCDISSPQADAQCQQLAFNRAYEVADAQQAAVQPQVAQQAAGRPGALNLPASAYEPVSVDYTTPSNQRRRVTVKRLSSYSDPASRQVCDTFTRISADLDGGTSTTSTARRCKGADGRWHEA